MADFSVEDYFPVADQTGVPLGVKPSVTLEGLDYDEASLQEGIFLEGPDTDQFVGPDNLYQVSPNNVSQGDLDDFLQSPGFIGIVPGSGVVTNDGVNTTVSFYPDMTLAPLTEYKMNLTGILDASESDITGFFTSTFVTGSGSIVELPSDVSSSVLCAVATESTSSSSTVALAVTGVSPADYSIQNSVETNEIIITFNKAISAASVVGKVSVKAIPATDHPNATVGAIRDIVFTTEVVGNQLKIKI
jgi:hypothetical protein